MTDTDTLREALTAIRDQEEHEIALDPDWPRRIAAQALATLSKPEPAAVGEVCEKLGQGEFFVDGDKFDLIFRPGGGNYGGADKIVARMACGETAYWLPSLIARFLNGQIAPSSEAISPPDARAVVEALDELDGSDFEAVRRHSATLRAALQSGASDTGEATERRRIVAWLRSHESTGYVEPFDEAANAIESCAHLTQSGASK